MPSSIANSEPAGVTDWFDSVSGRLGSQTLRLLFDNHR